jgi:hypothetical protein
MNAAKQIAACLLEENPKQFLSRHNIDWSIDWSAPLLKNGFEETGTGQIHKKFTLTNAAISLYVKPARNNKSKISWYASIRKHNGISFSQGLSAFWQSSRGRDGEGA